MKREESMLRKLRSDVTVSPTRMTALVTGGAGFIGSHLCDRLVQSGHRVICLDNLYTGDVENIRPLLNHPAFSFIEQDVTEPLTIAGPVHRIFNLACPASPQHYQRDPIGTMKTCVLGAYHVLELAREKGARILQASTSEVYGDPEVHPQQESYVGHVNSIGPRACYDEGKRAAEAMFFDYRRVHGVSIKVARIFNTYGPRMMENDGRVVSNFIVQALRGDPITVYGRGNQSRSFCYVDDLVDGLVRFMESESEITGPFNLGNPFEVTVEEIARRILAQTGSRSKVRHLPLPQDDPKRRKPVIDRAASALGWSPKIDLDRGLKATIGYFALKLFSAARLEPALSERRRKRAFATVETGRRPPTDSIPSF
jgi:UDP-glucuronate decarboxylase